MIIALINFDSSQKSYVKFSWFLESNCMSLLMHFLKTSLKFTQSNP